MDQGKKTWQYIRPPLFKLACGILLEAQNEKQILCVHMTKRFVTLWCTD